MTTPCKVSASSVVLLLELQLCNSAAAASVVLWLESFQFGIDKIIDEESKNEK